MKSFFHFVENKRIKKYIKSFKRNENEDEKI